MPFSRMLMIAAAPVSAFLLSAALAGGTASAAAAPASTLPALPRSCVQYSSEADSYYNSYVDWYQQAQIDEVSGSLADFEDDVSLAQAYYSKYQTTMTAASRAGCF